MNLRDDRGYRGMGMEGAVANWYARNTRRDLADFQQLARRFARQMPHGSRVLEVAPGPGYLAIELAKLGDYRITGLDVSKTFVRIARDNAREAAVEGDFQLGNACAMPFADDSFDLILCRAAFKNFSQPLEALNEMHRVLRPGGRAVIVDLRKDVSMEDIDGYIKRTQLGAVNAALYKIIFRYVLIPRAYSSGQFMELAVRSRFGGSQINAEDLGFEITLTKRDSAA